MIEINMQFVTKTLFFHKSLQKHRSPCQKDYMLMQKTRYSNRVFLRLCFKEYATLKWI